MMENVSYFVPEGSSLCHDIDGHRVCLLHRWRSEGEEDLDDKSGEKLVTFNDAEPPEWHYKH